LTGHEISLNRKCPCTQRFCPIRGNCVLCVQNHLEHRRHIPECIQDMLRESIRTLADKMELKTADARPDDVFWQRQAETNFLAESIARHRKPKKKGD
jgi:hypothetical protein